MSEQDKAHEKPEKDPFRPKRISDLFRGIADKYDSLQKKFSQKAQEFGYSKDISNNAGKNFENIPDDPMLDGVEKILKNQFELIRANELEVDQWMKEFPVESWTFSTASTAGSTAMFFTSAHVESIKPPDSWTPERRKEYIEKFSKLDPELGKTFSGVWETFYGTADSPEKNALYGMRQTFDHFFRILAPDDKVRESEYFKSKIEDKDIGKVYRSERMVFVANTKIKNKKLAELLISKAQHVLNVYEKLNKMHSEKNLNREQVRELLTSMQSILEEWIDAVNA